MMNPKSVLAALIILCCTNRLGHAQQANTCSNGGTLSAITTGEYKGRAFDLLRHKEFRKTHDSIAAKEYPWIKSFDGPSPENRVFAKDGSRVVVFSSCKPRMCDEAQLYGAIDTNANTYAVLVIEKGIERVLGKLSANAHEGIKCARSSDEALAKRTLDEIRKDAQ